MYITFELGTTINFAKTTASEQTELVGITKFKSFIYINFIFSISVIYSSLSISFIKTNHVLNACFVALDSLFRLQFVCYTNKQISPITEKKVIVIFVMNMKLHEKIY